MPFSTFVPLLHTACSWNNMYMILPYDMFVYSFFQYYFYVYYVYKSLVIEFILSFLLFYSLLVYHGYANANIGPWWVGTR